MYEIEKSKLQHPKDKLYWVRISVEFDIQNPMLLFVKQECKLLDASKISDWTKK